MAAATDPALSNPLGTETPPVVPPVDNAGPLAGAPPEPAAPSGTAYNPSLITQEGSLAEDVNKLAMSGSPLMQYSATQAAQDQNRFGRLSSTMATQAIETARLTKAVDIADRDRASSLLVKQNNAAAINRARELKTTGSQALEQIGKGGEVEGSLITQRGAEESRLIKERGDIDLAMQGADAATRKELQALQAGIDTDLTRVRGTIEADLVDRRGVIEAALQSADAATRKELQSEQGNIDAELAGIRGTIEAGLVDRRGQIEKDLQSADAATRSSLLGQQAANDKELETLRGGIQKSLTAQRGEIDTALQSADATTRKELQAKQFEIDTGLAKVQSDLTKDRMSAQKGIDTSLMNEKAIIDKQMVSAQGAEQSRLQAQKATLDMAMVDQQHDYARALMQDKLGVDRQIINLQTSANIQQAGAQFELEKQLQVMRDDINREIQGMVGSQALEQQGLRGDQGVALAEIEGKYRVTMQNSASAATVYANTSQAIGQILSNPEIPANSKQSLINHHINLLSSGLEVINAYGAGGTAAVRSAGQLPGTITSASSGESSMRPPPLFSQYDMR